MSLVTGIGGTLSGIASGNPLGGIASGISNGVADLALKAVSSWVLNGTAAALKSVAQLIGQATAPQLESSWFSGTYWQVAGLASLLTLPFLFAAAIQALLRGDLTLLIRAAFMYLPMALLGVALAAPVVMLLLAATDEMCSIVSGGGASGGAQLLDQAAAAAAATSALDGSPFFAFVVGLIALAAALALTLELMIRAAAVYVVVLMLPLTFAAMVWPARRVWAVRVVEMLTSLILSKFVIVAVLSLAGAAFGQADGSSTLLTAMTLLLLSTFAPWALMRLLPFTEVAAAATGNVRSGLAHGMGQLGGAAALAEGGIELAGMLSRPLRSDTDTGWDPAGTDVWRPGSGTPDGTEDGDAEEETYEGTDESGSASEAGNGAQGGGGGGGSDGADGVRGGNGPDSAGGRENGEVPTAIGRGMNGTEETLDPNDARSGGTATDPGGGDAEPAGSNALEDSVGGISGRDGAENPGADAPGGASGALVPAVVGIDAGVVPADRAVSGGFADGGGGASDPGGADPAYPAVTAGEPGAEGQAHERFPGLDPVMQAENQTWTPMRFGPGNWSEHGVYGPDPAADAEAEEFTEPEEER